MDSAIAIAAAEMGDMLINTNGKELLLLGAVARGNRYRYHMWHMDVRSKRKIGTVHHFAATTVAPATCDEAIDQFSKAHGFALNGWEVPY